jgi:polysaccharide pyruvyl transferase WcaK-like protein
VIAKLCRCKLLFVSVGGGAVWRPLNWWFVRAAVALADYRSCRDADSKECLAAMGADVRNDPAYPISRSACRGSVCTARLPAARAP